MADKKVLVIDDEPGFVEAVKMRLEAGGYEVIAAYDGKEGVEKARREMPNLILLDLVMPRVNGFAALSDLKRDIGTSHIPVIVLTAKTDTEYIMDAGKLGASDYIVKPASMQHLMGLIRKHLP